MTHIPTIQYVSDLHLEFYANVPRDADFFRKLVIPAINADILVLAGDIGHAEAHITEKFIGWCCSNWKYVIWVYGNHEYYNKKPSEKWRYSKANTMAEKEDAGLELQYKYQNLRVLNRRSVIFPEYPDFVFIGATLWTFIPEGQHANIGYIFSDFKYICAKNTLEEGYTRFTPEYWSELHKEDLDFILADLEEYSKYRCVVITHHLPSYDMILDHFKHDEMNYGFATNLDHVLTKPQVAAWICGHSHGQKQILKGPCYLNARGYPNESSQQTYNPSKYFKPIVFKKSPKLTLEPIPEGQDSPIEAFDFV